MGNCLKRSILARASARFPENNRCTCSRVSARVYADNCSGLDCFRFRRIFPIATSRRKFYWHNFTRLMLFLHNTAGDETTLIITCERVVTDILRERCNYIYLLRHNSTTIKYSNRFWRFVIYFRYLQFVLYTPIRTRSVSTDKTTNWILEENLPESREC